MPVFLLLHCPCLSSNTSLHVVQTVVDVPCPPYCVVVTLGEFPTALQRFLVDTLLRPNTADQHLGQCLVRKLEDLARNAFDHARRVPDALELQFNVKFRPRFEVACLVHAGASLSSSPSQSHRLQIPFLWIGGGPLLSACDFISREPGPPSPPPSLLHFRPPLHDLHVFEEEGEEKKKRLARKSGLIMRHHPSGGKRGGG